MEHINSFLVNLALVLGVAAVTTVIFQKIRQPVVLGYLIAGVIIGPHVPIPLFADPTVIHELAELGVILIMFAIGLEFSIGKLIKMAPTVGIIATLQCIFMIWLGYIVGGWLGWGKPESLCAGAIIAISSTTIIAKAFEEAKVSGHLTSLVFGILIFEDLIAVLMLAVFPLIFSKKDLPFQDLMITMGSLSAFLGLVMIAGMLIVPRLTRVIVKLNRAETTTIFSIGFCFLLAILAKTCGYSVALGAFLAGALIAESGEQHKIEVLIRPIRDVFSAIFFVAVGMLINPFMIMQHWAVVLLFVFIVIVGKIIGVSLGAFMTGYDTRTSIKAGMSLAQIGEFSFILAGVAMTNGVVGEFMYSLAVGVSAITTLSTPWLIQSSDTVAKYVDRKLPKSLQTFVTLYGSWIAGVRQSKPDTADKSRPGRYVLLIILDLALVSVILLGTSYSFDSILNYVHEKMNIPAIWVSGLIIFASFLMMIPFLLGIVRCSKGLAQSLTVNFPSSKVDEKTLDLAATPRKAFIVTIQLGVLSVCGLLLLVLSQSFLRLHYGLGGFAFVLLILAILFWRNVENLQGHVTAGAQAVLELLSSQSHPSKPLDELSEQISKVMPGLGTVTYLKMLPEYNGVGKTLAEINLRGMTGTSVIAIKRNAQGITKPSAHEQILEGDVLVMTGSTSSISAAREILE